MKKKKSKKKQTNSNLKDQKLGQTKNSAKLVLFVFGIGPIIGIIIFLYSKGFFNSPNMWILIFVILKLNCLYKIKKKLFKFF